MTKNKKVLLKLIEHIKNGKRILQCASIKHPIIIIMVKAIMSNWNFFLFIINTSSLWLQCVAFGLFFSFYNHRMSFVCLSLMGRPAPMLADHFRVLCIDLYFDEKFVNNHKPQKRTGDKNSIGASNIFRVSFKEFLWKNRAYDAECFKRLTTMENECTGYRVKDIPSIY